MRVILRRGTDQVVTLKGLRTADAYLNSAMVTATLYDSKEKVVPAFANVPMLYVPGSNGAYEWRIAGPTMMLPKSVEYTLEIKGTQEALRYRTVHVVSVVDGEPSEARC